MAMFLGHTAFMLELSAFVAGLVLWHFGRQGAATLLQAGGLILVVGAGLAALCTAYYMVRYQVQGGFDHAYPAFHHGMKRHEMMMGRMGSGMMRDMMEERMREENVEVPPVLGEAPTPPGHEEHHPKEATE